MDRGAKVNNHPRFVERSKHSVGEAGRLDSKESFTNLCFGAGKNQRVN